jgi:hypothetical protein
VSISQAQPTGVYLEGCVPFLNLNPITNLHRTFVDGDIETLEDALLQKALRDNEADPVDIDQSSEGGREESSSDSENGGKNDYRRFYESLQVQDPGNILGAHRHYVLSNPEDWFHYVDTFGQEGVKVFFEGVSDRWVKWWCTWFHELEELQEPNRDESVHLIKDLVDRRVTDNPNGPLSDALASEWYTQTLAPAAKRHNAVLQVKKKISQLTETWGVGWEAIIDPGMLVLKLLQNRN